MEKNWLWANSNRAVMKHSESARKAARSQISSDGYPVVIRIKNHRSDQCSSLTFLFIFFYKGLDFLLNMCQNSLRHIAKEKKKQQQKQQQLKAQSNNRCGFQCLDRQRPSTSSLFPVRSQFGWNRFHPSCFTETIMLCQRIQAIAAASWGSTWQCFGCRQLSLHPAKCSWSRANVTGGRWCFCPRHPLKTMGLEARPLIILSFRSVPMWQRGQRWTAETRANFWRPDGPEWSGPAHTCLTGH